MGIAVRKEKHDINFLTFEELEKYEENYLKGNGGIQFLDKCYTFIKSSIPNDFEFLIKKVVTPVYFELETETGKVKVKKDNILIMNPEGIISVMKKSTFDVVYKKLEE